MRKAAIYSAVLHVMVVLIAYFGLPTLFRPAPVPDQPVPVDLVMEFKPAPPPKVKPAPPPPRKKPVPVPVTPKVEMPPPPPPQVARLEVEPKPKPKPKPKAKPKAKPEPKAKPKPKARAKPVPKPKAKPKPPPDRFQKLLKNLAKQKRKQDRPARKPPEKPEKKVVAAEPVKRLTPLEQRRLAATIALLVKQQISACWSIPGGAKDVENMNIEIRILLNPDGTLRGAPRIQDQARMASDPFFRAVAESALRALRKPLCSPLKLPFGEYDVWKEIILTFNPREALG